ncbi:MAG: hypothetical protein HY996_04080 [Micrococcales bacterium]|nr:hypothetical protein [Micrococcales bacterium]
MATTYIAVLLDPPRPGLRTSYPGVSYLDDGAPMERIRVRYTDADGAIRATDYTLVGRQEDPDRVAYAFSADAPWDSASRTAGDWLIDGGPDADS